MRTIICPRCKGKGEVFGDLAKNPFMVVVTLGLVLTDKIICPRCNGNCILEIKN